MYKYLINKIFILPRFFRIFVIILLDLLIVLSTSYLALAIRLDELILFNVADKILINIEFFLIPLITFFIFAILFKFYSSSFRHYNLGNDIFYLYPLMGLTILLLNLLLNEYFSYGAVFLNFILIFLFIIITRKLISKLYYIFQNQTKINSILVCSSKNLHKIHEYLKLNEKVLVRALLLVDLDKIDFSKYRNYKIKNIKDLSKICEEFKIKEIYSDEYYGDFKKKFLKKISINVLNTDNLFKNSEIDIKQKFIDKYFSTSNKIKIKSLNYYKDKIILITGAGGSIGKNLFFELMQSKPKKIILVEQDELKLFNLKKDFESINSKKFKVVFKLGNLSNKLFLKEIFLDNKQIDYVLHAAAYKHVGLGEENVFSFVKNNIFVTYNLAKISISKKVKKFIFISTDKAVNPKSVMGRSKSICEKVLIHLNDKHKLKNVFKIVRFGNVINSDGSVLPIFERQILNDGPVTITNKDVTRYFMSIKNACQLVLHTIEIDKKIGMFILDMGKSYKILNIAKSMINFYLKNKIIKNKPKIIFIGLQKGEKIYEELVLGKNLVKTRVKNILTANEKKNTSIDYSAVVQKLNNAYANNDQQKILNYLKDYA
jgi:FlaA1/EpsC-like NDP-sugar epimerase